MTASCRLSCAPKTAACATASGHGTSCASSGPAASGPPPSRSGRHCCGPPAVGVIASCWCCCGSRGLRIGEALGLRRSDLHLIESATALGCQTTRAHLDVVPRENANGARAKGRRERVVPLAHHVVSYYDLYLDERERCRAAADCDFVLVNLFAAPLGAPMRYSR